MNNNEKFKKYNLYFEPVVIVGLDYKILYKNLSTKPYLLKLRRNNSIKRFLNLENMAKLDNMIKNETLAVIDIDVPPPFNCCVADIDEIEEISETGGINREKVIVLIFFSSINLAKNSNDYTNRLLNLIELYNTEVQVLNEEARYRLNALSDSFAQHKDAEEIERHLNFVTKNYQKVTRLQLRFNSYIIT